MIKFDVVDPMDGRKMQLRADAIRQVDLKANAWQAYMLGTQQDVRYGVRQPQPDEGMPWHLNLEDHELLIECGIVRD